MAYQSKENSGALFENRSTNERAPKLRGDANIDGTVYEIAAWEKQGSKGTFWSLSFKPKEQREEAF